MQQHCYVLFTWTAFCIEAMLPPQDIPGLIMMVPNFLWLSSCFLLENPSSTIRNVPVLFQTVVIGNQGPSIVSYPLPTRSIGQANCTVTPVCEKSTGKLAIQSDW